MTSQTGPFPPATAPWNPSPGTAGNYVGQGSPYSGRPAANQHPNMPQLPQLNPQTGLPTGAEYRDLAYHRLALSDTKHRRWSPLAEGGALLVGIVAVSIIFGIVGLILILALESDSILAGMESGDMSQMDMTNPWLLLFLFGSVAIWLPVSLLVRWLLRPRPLGLIWSVTGRIRWKWLLLTMGIATAVFVVIYGAVTVLDVALGASGAQDQAVTATRHPLWWLTLSFAFLVVPIQCTAEELVFRGYLAQSIGRWLKNPAWAILLPAPLFMLGHMYDVWGQLSVLWMAIVTGFLTWRTGGLEAAISLHVVNNMVVTVSTVIWPVQPADAEEASVGWLGFGTIFAIEFIYAVIVLLLIRRGKIAVTRRAVVWPKKAQDSWYDQVRAAYAAQAQHYRAQFGGPAQFGAPGPFGGPAQVQGGLPMQHTPQGHGSAPVPVGHGFGQAARSSQGAAGLVPVSIPASMAYVDDRRINNDGSLNLVPAEGLIAYAAPELEQVPGSDPPVYAHPVVWMARKQPGLPDQPGPVPASGAPGAPTTVHPNQEGQQ